MIIRRVTIRDWRALSTYTMELQNGLNILSGPNEAGKSSVVEAIWWALHQDLVGGAQVKEKIVAILPFADARKKPSVELMLEFPQCRALISKTLAAESAQRVCRLTVQRANQADQHFDQGAAQEELRRLVACDGGISQTSTAGVDLSLLVSIQGRGTHFVGEDLSVEARSAISIGDDGVVAPTARLSKVRAALLRQRKQELMERLQPHAVDAARKSTEAAQLRQTLAALRQAHAEYSRVETQITHLREQITALLQTHKQACARTEEAQREWLQLRTRHESQLTARSEVAEKRRTHDAARSRRDNLQKTITDIALLRGEIANCQAQAQQWQGQLQTLRATEAQEKSQAEAAWQRFQLHENQRKAARELVLAWDRALELQAVHTERRRLRALCAQRDSLTQEIASKRTEIQQLGRVPLPQQIAHWRSQFATLEHQRHLATQVLKLVAQPQVDSTLIVRADEGESVTHTVQASTEVLLHGQSTLSIEIAGWGTLVASTASSDASRQRAEIAAITRALEKDLTTFGATLAELPAAFDEFEVRRAALTQATHQLQFCERQLESALAGEASDVDLDTRLQAAQAEYSRLREECEPLRALLPVEWKPSQAPLERERANENERALQSASATAQLEWKRLLAVHSETAKQLGVLEARWEAGETKRVQSAAQLLTLESDGLDDATRNAHLEELSRGFWRAGEELKEALRQLETLGEVVNEEELAFVEHEAGELRAKQQRLETELAEIRVELRGYCEQDPTAERGRLEFEIATAEDELERHEIRLRGLVILETALEAERHRLGRAIAAPLNEHLSPWLSSLRNKPTRVQFDENTGRLTGVLTSEAEQTTSLPFFSHSGGMQEQTALALRLILAQASAKKLPSGKLPIVLDDPLTQSDSVRGAGLWQILQDASCHLQILLVTCHQPVWLESGDAHRIELKVAHQ